MGNIIELVDVYKKVKVNKNDYYLLENINIGIKRGTITIIKGESGSGKTTLLNVITGLDKKTSGDIYFNGFLVRKKRYEFGIVFQELNLFPNLNIYQNIKIGNLKKPKKDVLKMMEELDLYKYRKNDIYELSGGECQKVAIARCFLKSKELIILDESTKSLDDETKFKVMEFLKYINEKYKTTIIMTTHDKTLEKYADKVITISGGKIEKVEIKGKE